MKDRIRSKKLILVGLKRKWALQVPFKKIISGERFIKKCREEQKYWDDFSCRQMWQSSDLDCSGHIWGVNMGGGGVGG